MFEVGTLDSSSTVSPEVRRPGSNKINTLGGDSGRRCLKCSVESEAGAPTVGSGGDSVAFAPGLNPAPIVTFPAPAPRTRRADFRHRALQWNHAPRTRTAGATRATVTPTSSSRSSPAGTSTRPCSSPPTNPSRNGPMCSPPPPVSSPSSTASSTVPRSSSSTAKAIDSRKPGSTPPNAPKPARAAPRSPVPREEPRHERPPHTAHRRPP